MKFDPNFGGMNMKLKFEDYLKTVDYMKLPEVQQTNIMRLIQKVNALLDEFGEVRSVTSGYRTMADHQRIYKEINEKNVKLGKPVIKVPMGSKHLVGAAVDLADADDRLKKFCTEDMLKKHELYMEHPDYTDTWCHLQIIKTASGNRIFKPY